MSLATEAFNECYSANARYQTSSDLLAAWMAAWRSAEDHLRDAEPREDGVMKVEKQGSVWSRTVREIYDDPNEVAYTVLPHPDNQQWVGLMSNTGMETLSLPVGTAKLIANAMLALAEEIEANS